jgi:hypothetical protein
MKKIPSASIETGMVLAKPIKGSSGNILLNKGTTLQAGMANRLQSWGIPVVFIEGEGEEGEGTTGGKKIDPEEIKKTLAETFSDVKSDPIMNTIHDMTLEYLLKKSEE